MIFRTYQHQDRAACLKLFDSNLDPFFTPEERPGFESFLDLPNKIYSVIEADNGEIVACGGVALEDGGVGSLIWGMSHRERHGQGLGKLLTRERIKQIEAMEGATTIRLGTSQHTTGFYEKFGFQIKEIKRDGYGPGLHHCEMTLQINSLKSDS